MATQPWWSVRLEQWRKTWHNQRYNHKNIIKRPKHHQGYGTGYSLGSHQPKLGLVILLCCIAGTAIGLVLWQMSHSSVPTAPVPQTNTAPVTKSVPETATKPQTYTIAKDGQLAVYWVISEPKQLRAIPIAITPPAKNSANQSRELERYALEQLLIQPPPSPKLKNTIPKDTKLLGFRRAVSPDGTEIWLDLSPEFTKGGGAASMQGRLVQLVYTATITAPNAAVYINIAGEPLTTLGGEGLIVNQPIRRADLGLTF